MKREIDLSVRDQEIVGVPAGVIGTAEMGPAFVPVTVGSFSDFVRRFGDLNVNMFGPYAVKEWLKNRTALTYVRVLGAGANSSNTDIENTRTKGTVLNAGFFISGSSVHNFDTGNPNMDMRHVGCVQFLAAQHAVDGFETVAYPEFTDNDSFNLGGTQNIYLVRGMVLCASGTRINILSNNYTDLDNFSVSNIGLDSATIQSYSGSVPGTFKLVISSSAAAFGTADGFTNIKILTASLDPESDAYISNILNTDPVKFQSEEHLLYAHFPVENELAKVTTDKDSVGIVSGSANTSISSGDTSMAFRNIFGSFNTRYQTCKTTPFISQPYGSKEYDLFHFECLSDGEVANSKYKISITSVRRSTDATNPYGAFTVEIRDFNDTDTSPSVLESYPNCTLNPDDDDYIAKKIGDINTSFNFDADSLDERRLVIEGKYPNVSARVRVVMNVDVDVKRAVPKDALPFGFRGLPVIKTNDSLTDKIDESLKGGHSNHPRLAIGSITGSMHPYPPLTASVLPPVPFRFKVTRGATSTSSPGFAGHPGDREITDSRLYWGVKFERLPLTASMTNAILNPNASSKRNELLSNYSKFLGISKLDALVTGSGADVFCNNKFTLARVALYNTYATSLSNTVNTKITGSAKEHMLDTAYIRNGDVNVTNYTVSDGTLTNRMTLASLMAITSSVYFNKFADYNKFTNLMYGGFDGVNILDKDMKRMNDRATSLDSYGKAAGGAIARYGMPSTFTPGVGTGPDNAILFLHIEQQQKFF